MQIQFSQLKKNDKFSFLGDPTIYNVDSFTGLFTNFSDKGGLTYSERRKSEFYVLLHTPRKSNKVSLIEKYTEYDSYHNYDIHYLVFQKNTKESTFYKYTYKYALSNFLKVDNISYRDDITITLRPYYN